jgi:glycosyltransferase involved in cell wall biosynthesis
MTPQKRKKPTKIGMLLDNNFTYDNRVKREALSLIDAGYEVHIFCYQYENSSLPVEEVIDGIHIHRIFQPHLIGYELVNPKWVLKQAWRLVRQYGRFEFIHVHDVLLLAVGFVISKLTFSKLIYDSHEYWHKWLDYKIKVASISSIFYANLPNKEKEINFWVQLKKYQDLIFPHCEQVFSVSPNICQKMGEIGNIKHPPVVLRNVPPMLKMNVTDDVKKRYFHKHFNLPPETLVFLYQGCIDYTRGVNKILESLSYIEDLPVVFVMMGPIGDPKYFERQIKKAPQGKAFYKDSVYGPEYLDWTASADVGIFATPNINDSYYYSLGNKLFEFIQSELPVLGPNFPDISGIIDGYHVGLTFDPHSPQAIADTIRQLVENPSLIDNFHKNIHRAKQELCWEEEQKTLLQTYEKLSTR